MTPRRLLALLLAASAALVSLAPVARAQAPALTLATHKLEITAKRGADTATGELVVLNHGTTRARLTAKLSEASSAHVTLVRIAPRSAGPGTATRVKATFAGLEQVKKKVEAELVLTGGGKLLGASVSVMPALVPSHRWAFDLVVGSLAAAGTLFFGVAAAVLVGRHRRLLFARAPGPTFSFSDSWATTLTTVGAVLGTVLGSAKLPEVPREIDKTTLVSLNLLFAAVAVAAPFVFQALRNPCVNAAGDDEVRWGFNLTLLLACALTFGALVGELAALGLLSWELVDSSGWRHAAVWAIVVAGVLAAYYAAVTAYWLARTEWPAAAAPKRAVLSSATREVVVVPSAPQRWSIL